VAGPATAKSLQPIVVLVRGTTSAPLFADRGCHLPTTDETGVHASAKLWLLFAMTQLKSMPSVSSNILVAVAGCCVLSPGGGNVGEEHC